MTINEKINAIRNHQDRLEQISKLARDKFFSKETSRLETSRIMSPNDWCLRVSPNINFDLTYQCHLGIKEYVHKLKTIATEKEALKAIENKIYTLYGFTTKVDNSLTEDNLYFERMDKLMNKKQEEIKLLKVLTDELLGGDSSVNSVLKNLEDEFNIQFDDEELINEELERHANAIHIIISNWLNEREV